MPKSMGALGLGGSQQGHKQTDRLWEQDRSHQKAHQHIWPIGPLTPFGEAMPVELPSTASELSRKRRLRIRRNKTGGRHGVEWVECAHGNTERKSPGTAVGRPTTTDATDDGRTDEQRGRQRSGERLRRQESDRRRRARTTNLQKLTSSASSVARIGSNSDDVAQVRPNLGQLRRNLSEFGRTSAEISQIWSNPGHMCPDPAQIWPQFTI